MKTLLVTFLVIFLASGVRADKGVIDPAMIEDVSARYEMCIQVGTPGTASHRFIYTNTQARMFVYKVADAKLEKLWETSDLGSKAASVFVTDLYGDGSNKLVVATIRGRVLIYDLNTFDLEWENLELGYSSVDYMAHANLDSDPQQEVVVIADKLLYIFDGLNKNIQWVSNTTFNARMILVADVDDDPQLEIILNTGRVIDSRFFNIEMEADGPFGERIRLLDINSDGYPDVIGEFNDFSIRVFDIWAQREMW